LDWYLLLPTIDWRAARLKDQWPKHLIKRGLRLTRRRVGSIIRDIIQVASRIVSHAGRKEIRIASGWPWSRVIIGIDRQLV